MLLTYDGLTTLEGGRPTRRADVVAAAVFVVAYFAVWGTFGVIAVLGLTAMGLMAPMVGFLALVPAATLATAGG